MSERNEQELLIDIIESIEKIYRYIAGLSFEEFIDDEKTLDAVVRNFEIIGEAANRISQDFKRKHQSVEWRRIIGLRNRIVHEYFGIDYQVIWEIIRTKLIDFKVQIKQISDIEPKKNPL
ncbi:MAG: hypothetical protein HW421_2160 [Ignavibacteria bacterium]|nr:hypothetical protein [Ignavibacteria bacterium]